MTLTNTPTKKTSKSQITITGLNHEKLSAFKSKLALDNLDQKTFFKRVIDDYIGEYKIITLDNVKTFIDEFNSDYNGFASMNIMVYIPNNEYMPIQKAEVFIYKGELVTFIFDEELLNGFQSQMAEIDPELSDYYKTTFIPIESWTEWLLTMLRETGEIDKRYIELVESLMRPLVTSEEYEKLKKDNVEDNIRNEMPFYLTVSNFVKYNTRDYGILDLLFNKV